MGSVTLRVTGGSISGASTAIKVEKTAEEPKPIITVTGGSISGTNKVIEIEAPANPTIKVTGGDFSHAVSSYVPDGCTEVYFEADGSKRYAVGTADSLADDIKDAKTITVLKGSALTAPDGATVKNQTSGDLSVNGITVASGDETVAHDWIFKCNDTHHWKACKNHPEVTRDSERHELYVDTCSICKLGVPHEWRWESDSTGHWQTCGKHEEEVTSPVSHTMKSEETGTGTVETCTVCGYKHNWKWEHNDTQHWQICTEHEGEVTSPGNHTMKSDATGTVETCTAGCGYSITHNWTWQHDDTQHWQTCTLHTGEEQNRAPHSLDADGKCADCGYVKPAALPPQTGDAAPLGAWMALMAVSAAGLCAALLRRRAHR